MQFVFKYIKYTGGWGGGKWSTPKIMYFISSLILLRFFPSDLPVVRVPVKCETKQKRNEIERNEIKRNETKPIETKRNEIKRNDVTFRFVSIGFVSFRSGSFRLISFRFVRFRFVSFRTLQVPSFDSGFSKNEILELIVFN